MQRVNPSQLDKKGGEEECIHPIFSAIHQGWIHVHGARVTTRSKGLCDLPMASLLSHERQPDCDDESALANTEAAWDFCRLGKLINGRIAEHSCTGTPGETLRIVCECGNPDCKTFIGLTWSQYQQMRRNQHAFIVAGGHADAFDRVVARHGAWMAVEKHSEDQT